MTEPAASPGAVSPPELPGTADAEGWRRLHPLSPLLRGGIAFIVVIGIIVANFRDSLVNLFVADRFHWENEGVEAEVSGDAVELFRFLVERGLLLAAIAVFVGVIAVIVLVSWIAWRFATYRVTDEAVESRRGVVFRTHRRAPIERIQSVNLQRPFVARAVGLTKIDVVTAGQGGKVELAYLGHRDAKTVREQILHRAAVRRSGGADAEDAIDAADAAGAEARAAEHARREALAAAPVGPDGYVHAESGGALAARAQDFVDVDVDPAALAARALVRVPVGRLVASIALSWEAVTLVAVLVAIVIGGALLEPGLILGIIPLVLVMAGVMFGQFNKGFNFTLSRGADAVRIGSGLTATTTETIPFGRIHAVEARQPLLWRRFGWWKVRITTAGHSVAQGGQNNLQNTVLPVGSADDVVRIIETLLPTPEAPEPAPEEPTPTPGPAESAYAAALRADLAGPAADALRPGPRAAWVLWWGVRRASLRIADPDAPEATLRITRGALTRSLAVMPLLRAQSVLLHRPLVQRALGLATVQAHTVLGAIVVHLRGIALADARAAFDGIERTVLRVQGAEAEARAAGSACARARAGGAA